MTYSGPHIQWVEPDLKYKQSDFKGLAFICCLILSEAVSAQDAVTLCKGGCDLKNLDSCWPKFSPQRRWQHHTPAYEFGSEIALTLGQITWLMLKGFVLGYCERYHWSIIKWCHTVVYSGHLTATNKPTCKHSKRLHDCFFLSCPPVKWVIHSSPQRCMFLLNLQGLILVPV